MASETETQWCAEPVMAGFCWARNLEEQDVIVEIIDTRVTSNCEDGWAVKRHGRTAARQLDELPRKVRFSPILTPPK